VTRLDEQTLEELDGQRWAPPEVETTLAQTVHRLRRVPLGQFEPRDLWTMIGQGVGLPYLIPKALVLLERDPFVEADLSTGDLLIQVFGVDDAFWQRSPELRRRAVAEQRSFAPKNQAFADPGSKRVLAGGNCGRLRTIMLMIAKECW